MVRHFTAIVFSIAVAAVSAMVFVIYHIDIHNPGKTIEWMQAYPERYLLRSFTLAVNTSDHYASRGSLFRGWDYLCSVFYFSSCKLL